MIEIESSSALQMTDSSASTLLAELNEKCNRTPLAPFVILFGLGVVGILVAGQVASWISASVAIAAAVVSWWVVVRDKMRRTTLIMYDLEPDAAKAFDALHGALDSLKASRMMWHIAASGKVADRKYHAGAGEVVKRSAIALQKGDPPLVKTNVEVPLVPVGRQTLAFMPDRLLVFDKREVGTVAYSDLTVTLSETRFIEDGSVPSDATVVGTTWQYVNKKGGPDKRFANNRELSICAYRGLTLSSRSGLNELLQISNRVAGDALPSAVRSMAELGAISAGSTQVDRP